MFNIGFTEMIVLAVLALLLIGPKQLPEVARTIGRFLNEIKRGTDTITSEFKNVYEDEEPSTKPGADEIVASSPNTKNSEENSDGKS